MTSPAARGLRGPVLAIALALLLGLGILGTRSAEAQTPAAPPPSPTAVVTPTDAQILGVEHQLLCPLCVNERLDVCTLAICNDMKQIVQQRVAEGASTESIIEFFEARYGPKVRADLPRKGFNLLLYGWVDGALIVTGGVAVLVLISMRRATLRHASASAGASPPPAEPDLDALIDEASREEFPELGGGPEGARPPDLDAHAGNQGTR